MNRKALLIGSPGVKGSDSYLRGVARDLQNYDRFLRSPVGGAWKPEEILTLEDPPASQVQNEIRSLKSADYSFVLFSGHGYFSANPRSTIVCLRKDEEMDSAELRQGSPKHTLLLDCCRVVEREILAEDVLAKADKASKRLNSSECRRYFDEAISKCSTGLIVLHACDVDEAAADDSRRGGYYAYSLLDSADSWAVSDTTDLSKSYRTLRTPRAHDLAAQVVMKLSGNRQNPQIEKPRTEPYFPFAIVA
ncbi:caspase family protein [Bradyrhizobium sp. UFLA05-109]